MWFAIKSPPVHAVRVTVLLVGLPKAYSYTKTCNYIIQSDVLSTGGDALSTLANSITNYIIFKNVEIFKNYFFQIKKYCEGK